MYGLYLSVGCWGGDYLRCCYHGRWVLCRAWQERALCVLFLGSLGRLIVVADRVRQAELVMPIARQEWEYVKICLSSRIRRCRHHASHVHPR
jgi:hypothetical protein